MTEKRKRRTLVTIIWQKSKRDAAIAGELRRRLSDTDVSPWLVEVGDEIYGYVIFLS